MPDRPACADDADKVLPLLSNRFSPARYTGQFNVPATRVSISVFFASSQSRPADKMIGVFFPMRNRSGSRPLGRTAVDASGPYNVWSFSIMYLDGAATCVAA